jgi:hypothetical protein
VADTLDQARELVALYEQQLQEISTGLAEVKTFLETEETTMADELGEWSATVAIYQAAGQQANVVTGLVESAAAEVTNLRETLGGLAA